MPNRTSPAARLLFVIDNDYGALGTVMYFLYRQPLAARTTLLLPPRAFEMHGGQLPVASRPYRSLQDILDIVETDSPDVVFLFSGYLLASQGLITIRGLQTLVRSLGERGCKVATSDPYLGTFRRIPDADVPPRAGAFHRNLERRLQAFPPVQRLFARLAGLLGKMRLKRHVHRVADLLEGLAHVYPVPMDPPGSGGARPVSFFNPLYIRSEDELRGNSANVSALPDVAARGPRWLFVLAQFDLEFQEKVHGRQGFVDLVAAKIRETLDSGRHPTFIGPATVIKELSRRFTNGSGVSLLPGCSFEEFEQRLLDAEMVFYWQIFSTSAFLRLWNGLPVFFFDQGHNSRLLGPMREAGLKHYFMGGSPIHLDIEKPLDGARLAEASVGFRRSAQESRQLLARLPTPEEMVGAILEPTGLLIPASGFSRAKALDSHRG